MAVFLLKVMCEVSCKKTVNRIISEKRERQGKREREKEREADAFIFVGCRTPVL